jgi:AcrR family transcriptional regulator
VSRAGPAPKPARGAGRPPRISREQILDAAAALLARTPDKPLTVARIAAEVDAVPAALYRHFAHADELLDGVLGRVLGTMPLQLRRRAGWQEQVRDWMTSLRNHLLRYPAVLAMIGRRGRTSPAWLETSAALLEILERAGLTGAALARAYLWVIETTVGIAMQEASLSLPEQIAGARAALAEMPEPSRTRLAPFVSQVAKLDGDAFFAFVAERTIASLELLAEGR